MIKGFILIGVILFSLHNVYADDIFINEIMYDPLGNDNNREYVEIYSNNNLEDYIIEDLFSSDKLKLVFPFNSSYSLIVEEGFNYSGIDASIYSVGKTIGNCLNNERDMVLIRDNSSKIIDVVIYNSKQGGRNNNKSLCKQGYEFVECESTPGYKNKVKDINSSIDYEIIINEFLPDPVGKDNAPLPDGEWIELLNKGSKDVDLRGFTIYDEKGHKFIISDVNFENNPVIKVDSYSIVYMNGKTILNNKGFEKFGIKIGNKILDEVSYFDSREGVSWARDDEGVFKKTVPTKGKKNIFDEENLNTNISIRNVYLGKDKKIKFGEQLRVRLKIYKGDTTKNNIKVYLKDLSKITNFNVYGKFKEYEVVMPLQIDPNCFGKKKEGYYSLIVDGLDFSVTQDIYVYGMSKDLCIFIKENKTENNKKIKKEAISIPLTTSKNGANGSFSDTFINKYGKIIYEANDRKAKRYALYFFCLVLILVLGAYIFDLRK